MQQYKIVGIDFKAEYQAVYFRGPCCNVAKDLCIFESNDFHRDAQMTSFHKYKSTGKWIHTKIYLFRKKIHIFISPDFNDIGIIITFLY